MWSVTIMGIDVFLETARAGKGFVAVGKCTAVDWNQQLVMIVRSLGMGHKTPFGRGCFFFFTRGSASASASGPSSRLGRMCD